MSQSGIPAAILAAIAVAGSELVATLTRLTRVARIGRSGFI